MAEWPERIRQIFVVQEANEAGIYAVYYYVMGVKVKIILDDYLPISFGHHPAFSQTHGSELWVCLAEKAFAKLLGNYEAVIGGDPTMAMNLISGAPSIRQIHSE